MSTPTPRNFATAITVSSLLALTQPAALATHISAGEVDTLRPALGSAEGYLNFVSGAEYTGHTNSFETPRDGGQDFSDNYVTVVNHIVEDAAGVSAATANIINDYEFANKIYAQAGIAIRHEGSRLTTTTHTSPFSNAELFSDPGYITSLNRSPNADTLNHYYVAAYDAASNGIANPPRLDAANHGSTVRDTRANNTLAHEFGHVLLNGGAISNQDPTDFWHSTDMTNLMFTTAAGSSTNLTDVGPKIGAIGNHDILTQDQIKSMHGNPGPNNPGYIKHANNIATHGDRADFDWVTDHRILETIAGGSNGADIADGSDFLIWEINPGQVAPSGHSGPGGDGHYHKVTDLNRPGFAAASFNTIDVFSNVNRYADNDTPGAAVGAGAAGGNQAVRRVKALDYHTPEFSVDGTSWQAGELVNVFRPGWTTGSFSDDFVARYSTDLEAKFVRIAAVGVDVLGHDGNTQIDAIIANNDTEPVTWLPWSPTTIPDPFIDGPSQEDAIIIDTPEGNTEFFIPDTRYFDGSFNEVKVPVIASSTIHGDHTIIDVSLPEALPPSFFAGEANLDMLLDIDLFGPGTSLTELPFSDELSPFFETTTGFDFAHTSLLIAGDETTHPDSQHYVTISLEPADGANLLFFSPDQPLFGGIPNADAEIFMGIQPPFPGDTTSHHDDATTIPLFSLTIAASTPGIVYHGPAGGSWDLDGNWSAGSVPITTSNALIGIDTGGSPVTGPATDTTIQSLFIGNNHPGAPTTEFVLGAGQITATHSVIINPSGQITGNGTINSDLANAGTVSPGNSHGIINITGAYSQTSSATLHIQAQAPAAGSPTPGTDHDQINITGPVSLDGTLDIELLTPGTPPTLGTTFTVMTFDDRNGTMFSAITGTLINTSLALAPLFPDTDDALTLRATIPGDLNFDNMVSVADLAEFALNFDTTPGLYNEATNENSWQLGDFNTDGAITVADLSLLALNFGFDLSAGLPASPISLTDAALIAGIDLAAVPEPATFAVFALSAGMCLVRRDRRNRG